MKLVHYYLPGSGELWGLAEFDAVHAIGAGGAGLALLATLLQWPDPGLVLREAYASVSHGPGISLPELGAGAPSPAQPHLLAPLDLQEVWAAGVTYQRSKVARMEESEG